MKPSSICYMLAAGVHLLLLFGVHFQNRQTSNAPLSATTVDIAVVEPDPPAVEAPEPPAESPAPPEIVQTEPPLVQVPEPIQPPPVEPPAVVETAPTPIVEPAPIIPAPIEQPSVLTPSTARIEQTATENNGSAPQPNSTAGPQSAAAQPSIVTTSAPVYKRKVPVRYPRAALQQKQEGLVVLELRINAQGRAEEIKVKQSSGFPLLDEAALEAARKANYHPAMVGNQPVPSRTEAPYRFVLPDRASNRS